MLSRPGAGGTIAQSFSSSTHRSVQVEKETLAIIAFLVFCGFVIANWMNRPKK